MISIRSIGTYSSAGILSAIGASLCCIVPVIAFLAGSGSIAASFSWIEPVRPYLIGLSVAVLAFAWYVNIKSSKTNYMDCNCETPKGPSFLQSKTFLSIITVFSILMMSFPLYAKMFYPKPNGQSTTLAVVDNKKQVRFSIEGMTCSSCELTVNNQLSKVNGVIAYETSYATKSSLVTFDKAKVDVKAIETAISKTGYKVQRYDVLNASNILVSFYEAPLVCHAAPSIGCGSKAKFILVDLEQNIDVVDGAWLNKKGTVVAIKWKSEVSNSRKNEIINATSAKYEVELLETDASKYERSFSESKDWFKGKEVDQLSREEAAIIAKNTIDGYKKKGLIKNSFEKQFKSDIQKIYTDLFLSISSYKDLTIEAYNKVEDQIQKAGEKYVGQGKIPHVELCTSTNEVCEEGSECCDNGIKSTTNKKSSGKGTKKSGKSCCDQN